MTCVRCGAALDGCSSHANCAKCSAPVWLSLDGDWLCVRAPAWLHHARMGATFWIWALWLTVLAGVVGYATPRLLIPAGRAWNFAARFIIIWTDDVPFVASLLGWLAAFLLTTINPAARATEGRWTLRRFVRLSLLAGIALEVLCRVSWSVVETETHPLPPTLTVAAVAADAVTCLGLIAYVCRLCQRLPDDRLCSRLELAFWGFAAYWSCSILQMAAWFAVVQSSIRHHGGHSALPYPGLLLAQEVLLSILSIWLATLLTRFRRELRKIGAIDS